VNLVAQELSRLPHLAGQVIRRHQRNGLGPSLISALSKHWRFTEISPALREFGGPQVTTWLAQASSSDASYARTHRPAKQQAGAGRATPSSIVDLTSRETEVLSLMARNLSNEEIAGELFIAISTVKTHVNHILRKLDQKTRIGAILEYQRVLQSSPPTSRPEIHPGYDSSGTPRD
jgi:DNA-binding CsgD family transcriptional regulator